MSKPLGKQEAVKYRSSSSSEVKKTLDNAAAGSIRLFCLNEN